MSELIVQQGIQAAIQSMTEFENADVVINDWALLDQYSGNAPYIIILNSDVFNSRQDAPTAVNRWSIPIYLYESFEDWQSTLDSFRNSRQALIDKINEVGTNRSAGSATPVTIDVVRSDGGLESIYAPYAPEELSDETLPSFIRQRIVLECEEY